MRRVRAWFSRLAKTFRRGGELDLDAEVQSHLDMHIADNLREGMSAEQARHHALIKLGGLEQTKQLYRDRLSFAFVDTFLQDIRVGARSLVKSRGLSLICIFVLALGIGATAALYSV